MEQKLQQINNRLYNIENILCCICNKLERVDNEELAILSLLGKIIKDIEGTQTGIDTANSGIDTANDGISTLSLDVGNVGQGVDDANEAIANIDCGSCDLTEVNNKLDEIISNIPSMKCKYKKNDDDSSSKTVKTKKEV